jgi:hypothetical protein
MVAGLVVMMLGFGIQATPGFVGDDVRDVIQAATTAEHPLLETTDAVAAESASEETPSQQSAPNPGDDSKKPPTPAHSGFHALFGGVVDDFKNLPSIANLKLVLAGGGVALAVHPVDQTVNAHLRSHYTLVNDLYTPARYFGGTPVQIGLSTAIYSWGRLFEEPKVSHLGMDLLQAQIVSEVLVDGMKIAVRRNRPDNSQGKWNFSFPSGHSAQTFAAATVIERHLGWKKSALAYLVALYVASSRLHDNVHYLSDVAFGAAVGAIAGRTVTRHGPNAWALIPSTSPGGGFSVMALRRLPD